MDINALVRLTIPSISDLSSDNIVESELTDAIKKSTIANKKGLTIAGGTIAGGAVIGAAAGGVKKYMDYQDNHRARAAEQLKSLVKPSSASVPASVPAGPSHVANITQNTVAGKSGDMVNRMGQAAGQWGQSIKSGVGGVADFAANNPHLALAATALGGVAALKRLRRRPD